MDDFVIVILALLVGIFLGIIILLVVNFIRGKKTESKATKMIEQAKKEAEKQKREAFCFPFVEVTGLEPATAWSQTRNATNCAIPRKLKRNS